jgi:hypothetical protein
MFPCPAALRDASNFRVLPSNNNVPPFAFVWVSGNPPKPAAMGIEHGLGVDIPHAKATATAAQCYAQ